jgi:hypothetical protein
VPEFREFVSSSNLVSDPTIRFAAAEESQAGVGHKHGALPTPYAATINSYTGRAHC